MVVSQKLAEQEELAKHLTTGSQPFSLKGIAGRISIVSYLKNVPLYFCN